MKCWKIFGVLTLIGLTISVRSHAQEGMTIAGRQSNAVPASVHALKAPGIENFYQLNGQIYSGSAPEGDAAFEALKALGVKTIVSVDGTKPDVETARRFGLRYVHLPFGYDGVPTNQARRLVKAAETLPGPIFVHCHHGLHRGPAGVAVMCMGSAGWTAEQAEAWMRLAGTATNYAGLYRSVEQFHVPSAETLESVSADFPETAEVSPLAEIMIQIDGRFDNLKLIKKAGYQRPVSNPDLDPANEALLLDELFKELLRSPVVGKREKDFHNNLADAEQAVAALYASLRASPVILEKADVAFLKATESCNACHKAHRN